MLDFRHYSISKTACNYPSFQKILESPFPRTEEEFRDREKEIYEEAARAGDELIMVQLLKAHNDKEFVKQAVDEAYENSENKLVNKGWKGTRILLPGGNILLIKTPYLRVNRKKQCGRKRRKRGKKGTGIYPVLRKLGVLDGVSPALRSEISLLTVQSSSYQECVEMLNRRGLEIAPSTVKRIAEFTANTNISLRDAALKSAMSIPISSNGAVSNKRVRVSLDGGRVRTRKNKNGRKTKKGKHRFSTPWREPRVIVIDILDDEGEKTKLRLPLYDSLIKDADVTFSLLIGYLRLLGAAHASVIEFISDGADWIWERVDLLISEAEIPESKLIRVLDFYHASEHLHSTVELCQNLSAKERKKLYKELRHILRHEPWGIQKVIERLKEYQKTRRAKKMQKALKYFEKHKEHMDYYGLDRKKLPIGSGQVESAVRRVINLRFKAPGSFWNEERVEKFMHLRSCFKSGRWDEMMSGVLRGEYVIPSFEPSCKASSPESQKDTKKCNEKKRKKNT